jgi:succinoglycan biosynthesis transport protein ExoP
MIPGLKKRNINFTDVMMYAALVMKYHRLMILLITLTLTGGLLYYVYAKPVYSATGMIRYQAVPIPLDEGKVFEDADVRSIHGQLLAPQLIQSTALRLGIRTNNLREITAFYVPRVRVDFDYVRSIAITAFAYSPDVAKAWPEAMIKQFLEDRDKRRAEQRESIVQNFTKEMANMTQQMRETLKTKFDYEVTNEMTQIVMELDRLRSIPHRLIFAQNRLEAMDRVRSQLQDPKLDAIQKLSLLSSSEKDSRVNVGQIVSGLDPGSMVGKAGNSVIVMPSMVESGGSKSWQEQEREMRRLERLKKELDQKYLPGHREMQKVTKEIEITQRSLEAEYIAAKNRFEIEYASLKESERELDAKLPEYRKAMQRHEQFQQDYNSNQSGQLAWSTMYADMAKTLRSLDYAANKDRSRFEFVGLTDVRDVLPVSPHRSKLVIYSLAAGLILAVLVPFMLELLDHTVTNVEETEDSFHIRGLGIVPKIREDELRLGPDGPLIGSDDVVNRHLLENFRVIRTNLVAAGMASKTPHVIMVSSAMPQEGKTVVSSNLALSFAQMGEKTLLIDADLRRGRLHRLFGYKSGPGLGELLNGKATIEEVCRSTENGNLHVMTCGRHMDGVTELLGSAKFAGIMSELRQRYQRIIVDTPPVLGLSETSMMQGVVDGLVFVVWCGRTPTRTVKAAVEVLHANRANFYGFVLNRLDLSDSPNYYQYYYYTSNYYRNYQAIERV